MGRYIPVAVVKTVADAITGSIPRESRRMDSDGCSLGRGRMT